MIGWLIAASVAVLLLHTKAGLLLSWKDNMFTWKIRMGPFLFRLPEEQQKQKTVRTKQKTEKTKKWARIHNVFPIIKTHWRELLELIDRVLRAPCMQRLRLNVFVGGSDPEECAMNYGRICAIISAVLPVVKHTFEIKKEQVDVFCCYEQPTTTVAAEALIILRFGELIVLMAAVLRQLLLIRKSIPTTKKAV